jgi:hypothetical protein
MPEISSLIMTADARELAKGEAALDSMVRTAQKAEVAVDKATSALEQGFTDAGRAAVEGANHVEQATKKTSAAVKEAAEQTKANAVAARKAAEAEKEMAAAVALSQSEFQSLRMSLDRAYAMEVQYAAALDKVATAERLGVASKAQAATVTAQLTREYQAATSGLKTLEIAQNEVSRGSVLMGGGARMVSQQLSQVAQMTMATGQFTQALAIQLPDLGLAFGAVGAAAGVVAGIALPLLVNWFSQTADAVEKPSTALQTLMSTLDQYNAYAAIAAQSTSELVAQFGSAALNVRQFSHYLAEMEAHTAIAQLSAGMADFQTKLGAAVTAQTDLINQQANLTKAQSQYKLSAEAVDSLTKSLETQKAKWVELSAVAGVLPERARDLNRAISELSGARGMQDVVDKSAAALQIIAEMYPVAADVPVALQGSVVALEEIHNKAASGVATTALFKPALDNATSSASNLFGAIDDVKMAANAALAQMIAMSETARAAQSAAQGQAAAPHGVGPAGQGDGSLAYSSTRARKLAEDAAAAARALNAVVPAARAAGRAASGGMSDAAKATEKATQEAKAYADAMKQPVVGAIDSVSNALGDWFSNGMRDGKKLFDSLVGGFKNALSQMVALAIRNKILVSVGMGQFVTGGASNAASVAAGGTGPAGLLGLGSLGGSFNALGGMLGIGSTSAAGTAAIAASGGSAIMAALPAIGAVVAGISLLAAAFKSKPTGSTLSGNYGPNGFSGQTTKSSSSLFGLVRHTSASGLDSTTSSQIENTLDGLKSGVSDMVTSLGLDAKALENFSGSFNLNTFNKSSSEVADMLSAALTNLGSSMINTVVDVRAYAKEGEKTLDTLTRLSQALPTVNSQLLLIGHGLLSIGLQGADAASKLADAFGGMEQLSSGFQTYFANFYTAEEQVANKTAFLSEQFKSLGVAMPASREAYRALVEAQDLNTQSGRDLFASLISLAGAMNEVLPAIGAVSSAISDLLTSTSSGLDAMITDLNSVQTAALSAAKVWYNAAQSLRSFIADLRGTSSALVSRDQARAANEARFQILLARTLSGDSSATGDLTSVAKTLLGDIGNTSRTATEAALAQAKIINDLNLAANVSDAQGGQQDVIADLLGQQKTLLTQIKNYLAGGGVLNPADIDALNAQLGGLQDAIEEVKAIDYASIVAHMDATVVVVDNIADPVLKQLLSDANREIEAQLNFISRTNDLSPMERVLALTNLSRHQRTVDLLADTSGLTLRDAQLALTAASTVEKNIRTTLVSSMTPEDRQLVLTTSGNLTRAVNLALGEINPAARELALVTSGEIARVVASQIAPGSAQNLATRLALAASSNLVRTVAVALGSTDPQAKLLALTTASDLVRVVKAYIPEDRRHSPATLLGLASASILARTVTATLQSGTSPEAVRVALSTGGQITKTVLASLGTRSETKALALALGQDGSFTKSVVGLIGSGSQIRAVSLALAANGTITKTVLGRLDLTGLTEAQKVLLLSQGSTATRTIFGQVDLSKLTEPQKAMLLTQVTSAIRLVTGQINFSGLTIPQRNFLMNPVTSGVRSITGQLDLSKLTAEQTSFLKALSSASGSLTLGGSFQWNPSTGFQSWYESTTKNAIALPLEGLKVPMNALREQLFSLTSEIRIQNAKDDADRAAAAAAAAKAKALEDAQAKVAAVAAARAAALTKAQGAVKAISDFDASHSGYLANAQNQQVSVTLNPDGTLNYNGATGVYGTPRDREAWTANFWNEGGLADQARLAAFAYRRSEQALQAARDQVIALGGVPAFAGGGNHQGGLRIVGERGIELEATGPARYYSTAKTRDMLKPDDGGVVSELRALRAEVRHLREQSLEFSSKDLTLQRRMTRVIENPDGILTRTTP